MAIFKKNWLKLALLFVACLLARFIPFRPPNIEPILAAQMPLAKAYGASAGFLFAFLSMALFDLLVGRIGIWTLITATTYGLVGLGAFLYFKNRKNSPWNYAKFAIVGTLFFDAITGLSIGPLFFGQSFMVALMGQIPFTFWHLLGNVSFALVLSPAIYNFAIRDKKSDRPAFIINIFHPKKIS